MTNNLVTFNFKNNQVRTQTVDGEPYFCLVDACGALGLSNSRKTRTQLTSKGVTKGYTLTAGGKQEITFINEPNLYRLIFRSNKPQAQAFADWVYSEVLPSIRKTGGYGKPASAITPVDRMALGGIVKRCVAKTLRESFGDLTASDDETAIWGELLPKILAARTQNLVNAKVQHIIDENADLRAKLDAIKKAVG